MGSGGGLRLRRLLALWWPLALTFFLLSGATPVINASINRLPIGHPEADLAAFAVVLSFALFFHSPVLVTREIAIKLSVDAAGQSAALRFCAGAGLIVGGLELLCGLTPAGPLVLRAFTESEPAIAGAHGAIALLSPMPVLIGIRGVFQAQQIRADDTLLVAFGTMIRLVATALFGLALAPHLRISGPQMGALCMTFGVALETAASLWNARKNPRPPATAAGGKPPVLRFALPLMFANFLGVASSVIFLRMAGAVPEASKTASIAAYHQVRSLQWLFVAGAMAIQPLTTAKAETPEQARAMLSFSTGLGVALSVLFGLCAFTPAREFVLVNLMGEKAEGAVVAFATPAMAVASAMPFLNSVRFGLRGVLIARGLTGTISTANLISLGALGGVLALGWYASPGNGAVNAYLWWTVTVLLEIGMLMRLVLRRR